MGAKSYESFLKTYEANTELGLKRVVTHVVQSHNENTCFIIEITAGEDTSKYDNAIENLLASFVIK